MKSCAFLPLILLCLGMILPTIGHGFPELTRHGYSNCTTCHVSPAGGGLLTLYGRELSKELLSTFSKRGEQYFAYNALPALSKNDKFLLGAYIRGLQVLRDNNSIKEARFILMQADFEAGYNAKDWAVAGTLGRQEVRSGLESKGRLFSRRHYLLLKPDTSQNIRLGKFLKSFGTGNANHYLLARKDLNFGYDTETYNIEYSWLAEKWNFFATYVTGLKTDEYFKNLEKGIVLNGSIALNGRDKLGLNFYQGRDSSAKRNVLGAWGISSFSKNFFILSEVDFQWKDNFRNRNREHGHVMSHQISYELTKGLTSFVLLEQKYLDYKNKKSELHSYGLGGHFYPRPHWELTGVLQREQKNSSDLSDNVFWMMGQFYL